MKADKKIAKGKFAVLKKNGKVMFTKKVDKGVRVEYDDTLFDIEEKEEKDLTDEEKLKVK